MIDTIALKHCYQKMHPVDKYLMIGWKRRYNSFNGETQSFVFNQKKGSNNPRLTLSKCPKGLWHVRAEVTPTSWLYGSNVKLSDENVIRICLNKLSYFVSELIELDFDATTAELRRVDFAQNFHIGARAVKRTISTLSNQILLGHMRILIDDKTIYFNPKSKQKSQKLFRNKNRTLRIYDKYAQVSNNGGSDKEKESSDGILRVESSFLTLTGINYLTKRLKLPNRKVNTVITRENSTIILNEVINQLNLTQIMFENNQSINKFEVLNSFYKTAKAQRLLGHLQLIDNYGENYYQLPNFSTSRTAYYRDIADCRKAGLF